MVSRWQSTILGALATALLLIGAAAQSQDAATLKPQLEKIIGAKDSWKVAVFAQLKKGMNCDAVKAVYANLQGCDPAQEWSFAESAVADDAIVSGYQLTFNKGALSNGTVLFKGTVDKDAFKAASLEAFEAKWGEIKGDKNEEILTWVDSNFNTTQRAYMVDHWELKNDFPDE